MKWFQNRDLVVPVDFSDESFAAIDVALQLAEKPSLVHVIHVLPLLETLSPGMVWDTVDEESRSEHAKKALKDKLAESKFEGIHTAITFGDAGQEIADFITHEKPPWMHLVLTGRNAAPEVIEVAHTVTEMTKIKHAYGQGIKAAQGVEF